MATNQALCQALARLFVLAKRLRNDAIEGVRQGVDLAEFEWAVARAEVTLANVAFRFCRQCGCSDTDACDPACGWAEADLCTNCAANAPTQEDIHA